MIHTFTANAAGRLVLAIAKFSRNGFTTDRKPLSRTFFPTLRAMRTKVLLDLGLPSVHRPAKRRALIDGVSDIQPCPSLDQQSDNRVVTG